MRAAAGPTIVLLTTTFDIGGAERVYAHLARGLARRGYRVLAACLQARSGALLREFQGTTVEAVDLGVRGAWDAAPAVRRLVRLLRKERVDVVYTFLFHAHIVGRMAARVAGVPIVLSSQQVMDWEGRGQELLNRLTARWCTRVIGVSKNVERYLAERVGIPPHKLATIYNCVDVEGFSPVDRAAAGRNGLYVLGSVARLNPEKDHATLIDALAIVKRRFPDVRLLLAGDGPERGRLEARARALGLSEHVEFLGHVSDVKRVYARLGVYVQSSNAEGLPCAVLEAQASGLPVIATRVGGVEEAVIHGEGGLLVEPRMQGALADAICWMFDHPGQAARMGEAGCQRMADHFSAQAMTAASHDLITQLLAGRAPSTRR